jgi:AraC-like DNA-binding protein
VSLSKALVPYAPVSSLAPPLAGDGGRRSLFLRFQQIAPVIRIAHFQEGPRLLIPERILFDHELVLILEGQVTLTFGSDRLELRSGDLLFLPPFTPHAFDSSPGVRVSHLAVHFDFSPNTPKYLSDAEHIAPYKIRWPGGFSPPLHRVSQAGIDVRDALVHVIERHAVASRDPLASLEASARLTSVLAGILRSAGMPSPGLAAVDPSHRLRMDVVVAYIAEHLAEPITLDGLAEVAQLSRSRFTSIFRAMTGESPLHYVQIQRIAEARRLLADPELSIKQIAARCGFGDPFHFSKTFRALDGLTPSQFRAAALAGLHEISPDNPQ